MIGEQVQGMLPLLLRPCAAALVGTGVTGMNARAGTPGRLRQGVPKTLYCLDGAQQRCGQQGSAVSSVTELRVPERFQSVYHVSGSGLLSFAVLPLIFLSHVGEVLQLHSSYRQRFPEECLLVPERCTACVAQVRPHPGRPHFVQCPAPFSCSSEARHASRGRWGWRAAHARSLLSVEPTPSRQCCLASGCLRLGRLGTAMCTVHCLPHFTSWFSQGSGFHQIFARVHQRLGLKTHLRGLVSPPGSAVELMHSQRGILRRSTAAAATPSLLFQQHFSCNIGFGRRGFRDPFSQKCSCGSHCDHRSASCTLEQR